MKTNLKKILFAVLLCTVLLCATLPMAVFAEDGGAAVSVGSASGKAGDTVTVSVNLNQNPGVIAMNLSVGYDPDQLELVSVSNAGVLSGYSSPAVYGGGSYTLNWEDALSTTNNNATGTIATMTFKLKENCDKANISVSGVGHDADVKPVTVSGSSGTITNTNPTTTTTTTKATTTKATTTTTKKATTTTKKATTTKRATTTSVYTRPYTPENTYPVDFEPTTEEYTTEILSITETMTEYVPEPITEESTTELIEEDENSEKMSKTRLVIIVLFVCFAIIGIGVIISMVRKSKV